ncbi:hypothetical protein ES703_61512 [subsurface metagenome]
MSSQNPPNVVKIHSILPESVRNVGKSFSDLVRGDDLLKYVQSAATI